ncbi:hypothetical protein HOLleu_35098 [Holothuria leucospilota]|uniref:Uncharacterized protein n=1 Tax=Holothuria leucospilota TaxID=206669 RepID=A0A9Q0YM84_HOLLE|nr:hypothetical protein HOLleu_35098 [Holothuria leucospilota]
MFQRVCRKLMSSPRQLSYTVYQKKKIPGKKKEGRRRKTKKKKTKRGRKETKRHPKDITLPSGSTSLHISTKSVSSYVHSGAVFQLLGPLRKYLGTQQLTDNDILLEISQTDSPCVLMSTQGAVFQLPGPLSGFIRGRGTVSHSKAKPELTIKRTCENIQRLQAANDYGNDAFFPRSRME